MSKSLFIVNESATMRKINTRTLLTPDFDTGQTEEAGNGNGSPDKLNTNASDSMCILD